MPFVQKKDLPDWKKQNRSLCQKKPLVWVLNEADWNYATIERTFPSLNVSEKQKNNCQSCLSWFEVIRRWLTWNLCLMGSFPSILYGKACSALCLIVVYAELTVVTVRQFVDSPLSKRSHSGCFNLCEKRKSDFVVDLQQKLQVPLRVDNLVANVLRCTQLSGSRVHVTKWQARWFETFRLNRGRRVQFSKNSKNSN